MLDRVVEDVVEMRSVPVLDRVVEGLSCRSGRC